MERKTASLASRALRYVHRARKEKPKVSAFTSAKIPKILELKPDLVLGFSDLQADIAAELIRHGIEVYVLNHRTVDGILQMIRTLGRLVDTKEKADKLALSFEQKISRIKSITDTWEHKPKVYFEEWYYNYQSLILYGHLKKPLRTTFSQAFY